MRFNPKTKSRWKWPLILGVPVFALLVAGFLTNTNPPTNTARTSPDEKPELRTRIYSQDVKAVALSARAVALAQKTWFKSWRIVQQTKTSASEATPRQDIEVEVPVLVFTDDLTVHIDTDEKGRTRVNVESKSRVGQGDFGENRRHIAQFLRALDKALGGRLRKKSFHTEHGKI